MNATVDLTADYDTNQSHPAPSGTSNHLSGDSHRPVLSGYSNPLRRYYDNSSSHRASIGIKSWSQDSSSTDIERSSLAKSGSAKTTIVIDDRSDRDDPIHVIPLPGSGRPSLLHKKFLDNQITQSDPSNTNGLTGSHKLSVGSDLNMAKDKIVSKQSSESSQAGASSSIKTTASGLTPQLQAINRMKRKREYALQKRNTDTATHQQTMQKKQKQDLSDVTGPSGILIRSSNKNENYVPSLSSQAQMQGQKALAPFEGSDSTAWTVGGAQQNTVRVLTSTLDNELARDLPPKPKLKERRFSTSKLASKSTASKVLRVTSALNLNELVKENAPNMTSKDRKNIARVPSLQELDKVTTTSTPILQQQKVLSNGSTEVDGSLQTQHQSGNTDTLNPHIIPSGRRGGISNGLFKDHLVYRTDYPSGMLSFSSGLSSVLSSPDDTTSHVTEQDIDELAVDDDAMQVRRLNRGGPKARSAENGTRTSGLQPTSLRFKEPRKLTGREGILEPVRLGPEVVQFPRRRPILGAVTLPQFETATNSSLPTPPKSDIIATTAGTDLACGRSAGESGKARGSVNPGINGMERSAEILKQIKIDLPRPEPTIIKRTEERTLNPILAPSIIQNDKQRPVVGRDFLSTSRRQSLANNIEANIRVVRQKHTKEHGSESPQFTFPQAQASVHENLRFSKKSSLLPEQQDLPINGHDRKTTANTQPPKVYLRMSKVQEIAENHLKEMHHDHEYRVEMELLRAQTYQKPAFVPLDTDLPSRAPNGLMGITLQKSPFQDMQPIETLTKKKNGKGKMIYSETYKGNKPVKVDVECPTSTYDPEKTKIPSHTGQMPKYNHYVSLKHNILGVNTRQMHVWPYFGIEDSDAAGEHTVQAELRDYYDIDIEQWPRKVYRSQQVHAWQPYVESFLEEIGCSMSDILYYLLEPDKEVVNKVTQDCQLRDRDELCAEDLGRSPSARWVKVFSKLKKPSPQSLRVAAFACTAFSEALPLFTDHSLGLTMWHVARKSQAARLIDVKPHAKTDPYALQCRICHLHDCPYHGEVREQEGSDSDTESVASEDALDIDYPPNINHKVQVSLPSRPREEVDTQQPTKQIKGKGMSIDWWMNETSTWNHAERRPFYPCFHPGQNCDQAECRCFLDKIQCEKACNCSPHCERRFRGCSCKRSNKKRCLADDRCECKKLNRECDPDLCGTCGVDLLLNRENGDKQELLDTCCRNAGIQFGVPKRMILGASKVHGFGVFAGEPIKQHEFVGEYIGEIIGKRETDRRGAIYEVQKSSYLFTLNREQEIDSQRFGNKIRFINHADPGSRYRNVVPGIRLCNMSHRIGMYALKDIQVGQELFFDYGKDYHQYLVSKEPGGDIVPTTKNRALIDTFDTPEDAEYLSADVSTDSNKRRPGRLPGKQGSSRPSSKSRQAKCSNIGLDASVAPPSVKVLVARKSETSSRGRNFRAHNSTVAFKPTSRNGTKSRSQSRLSEKEKGTTTTNTSLKKVLHASSRDVVGKTRVYAKQQTDDESDYDDHEVADSEAEAVAEDEDIFDDDEEEVDTHDESSTRSIRTRTRSLRVGTTNRE